MTPASRLLRAVADSLFATALSLLNPPIFVLWLVGLVLCPVSVLGINMLTVTTTVVRWRADLERGLADRAGVPIKRPYIPVTDGRRLRGILTDPGTWRDLAWLLPGTFVSVPLGLITVGITAYGLVGVCLLPLWLYLGGVPFGYGMIWPTGNFGQAWLALPQGIAVLALVVALAPLLQTTSALFARTLLAPTGRALLMTRVNYLFATRADAIDAQAAELRRIERDLHDGAQARMASVAMTIGMAERLVRADPGAALGLLAEARQSSTAALAELRNLVRGIHPPVLAERGLEGAVRALALSLPLPVLVDSYLPGRPDTPVESAVYFAVAEALANMSRHSGATAAWVMLRYAGGNINATVGDNGVGGADAAHGTGLQGVKRRLAAFDGTTTISSPVGGPTLVTMEVPCVLSSPRI